MGRGEFGTCEGCAACVVSGEVSLERPSILRKNELDFSRREWCGELGVLLGAKSGEDWVVEVLLEREDFRPRGDISSEFVRGNQIASTNQDLQPFKLTVAPRETRTTEALAKP
jgi:hypothetical protein